MRVKTREKIEKEQFEKAQKAFINQQYDNFNDSSFTFACLTTVCVIAVMEKRGRSKAYIKQLFKDLCFMYDHPQVFGKSIKMTDLIKEYSEKYEINFDDIRLQLEDRKSFMKNLLKRQ